MDNTNITAPQKPKISTKLYIYLAIGIIVLIGSIYLNINKIQFGSTGAVTQQPVTYVAQNISTGTSNTLLNATMQANQELLAEQNGLNTIMSFIPVIAVLFVLVMIFSIMGKYLGFDLDDRNREFIE